MATKTHQDESKKVIVSALSNSFSTGGGGVDFEHRVQATFLLALLVESHQLLRLHIKQHSYVFLRG